MNGYCFYNVPTEGIKQIKNNHSNQTILSASNGYFLVGRMTVTGYVCSEPWTLGTGSSLTLKHCGITAVGVKFKPLYGGSITSAGPCIRPALVETLFLQT